MIRLSTWRHITVALSLIAVLGVAGVRIVLATRPPETTTGPNVGRPTTTPAPSMSPSRLPSCPKAAARTTSVRPAMTLDEASREVGGDHDRALDLVARGIRFEAYRGALRGPQGTLDATAGNAVDKS